MARHASLILLAFLTLTTLHAQERGFDRGRPGLPPVMRTGDQPTLDALVLPSDSAALCRVDVLVRVPLESFVFTRTRSMAPDSAFSAAIDVTIDILGPDGVPVRTTVDQTVAHAAGNDAARLRDRHILVAHAFHLAPGRYRARAQVSDQESRDERPLEQPFGARLCAAGPPVVAAVIPLAGEPTEAVPGVMLGGGGSVLFASPAWVAVTTNVTGDARWNFTLRRPVPDEDPDTVAVWDALSPSFTGSITGAAASGVVQEFRMQRAGALNGSLAMFRLPTDTIDAGMYELVVRVRTAAGSDSLLCPLRVLWREMPFTLRTMALAIPAMRYVLTEEEYDDMERGEPLEQERKLMAWWKASDPTPGTIVNERMTEYFRRADQAFTRFQTMTKPNGVLTDRGKILILFGEPESTERILAGDGSPEEVWQYPSIRRTFRFIDRERKGNYRLK